MHMCTRSIHMRSSRVETHNSYSAKILFFYFEATFFSGIYRENSIGNNVNESEVFGMCQVVNRLFVMHANYESDHKNDI